jgi:hypothetical protein
MDKIKAKFKCDSIQHHSNGDKMTNFSPVDEKNGSNKDFSNGEPSGELRIYIEKGTDAINFFEPGKNYYLTIEKG